MLIVLSPAKSLDYDTPATTDVHSLPDFIDHSAELITRLRKMAPAQLASLMRISDALAALNVARYASWSKTFTVENAKQALLAFDGDVYDGLQAKTLDAGQLAYAQSHIRILSGLYGVLRPLDLMQPYRLEMGTRLANRRGKDLYAFWDGRVSAALNQVLAGQESKTLVNLASEEYFKVVKTELLDAAVITPVFEDWKDGRYKVMSFYAKRARGMMARYATVNGLTRPDDLKDFNAGGYAFDAAGSSGNVWRFRRRVAER